MAELTDDGAEDPFAQAVYSAGLVVDLSGTHEELEVALLETVEREGALFATGMECDLKNSGQDCRTCPLAQLSYEQPRARLCRLGKDQFALAELMQTAARDGDELRPAAEEFALFAQLDEDLSELLAAVGL